MTFLVSFLFIVIFLAQQSAFSCLAGENDVHLARFVVSATYGVCVMIAYPITTGCLNPAAALAISLVNYWDKTFDFNAV